jgi:hypothetical protein
VSLALDHNDTLRRCRNCRHFRNDARYLEEAFPGLTSMSSGFGSVCAEDGICTLHARYLGADSACPSFAPARENGESRILLSSPQQANPSLPEGSGRQTSSYFSKLIARLENRLLSGVQEHVGVPSMTDLPHELNGLTPPSVTNWLVAFGTALIALIAVGILPRVWG